MTIVSIIGCFLVLWGLATRSKSVLTSFLACWKPSATLARSAGFALIPLYAAQLSFVVLESRLESVNSPFAWMKSLPLPVFDHRDNGSHHIVFAWLGLTVGIADTIALAIIVCALRHNPRALERAVIVSIAGILALMSVVAPAMSTPDPYEFAATGLLGFHAYAPPTGAFIGTAYESYQKHIPLNGVIYGPLWLLIDMAQTSFGSSIYEKIEALRVTNVAFIGAFLALLSRAGISRSALIGFALSPCLWFYFVANPHADIEGLTLLAAAYGYGRRSKTALLVLCIVAAGLIKLPFVIVGGALLTPMIRAPRRLIAWGTAVALVLAISYLVPGPVYIHGLSTFAAQRASVVMDAGWPIIAIAIALASFILILFQRGLFGATLLFQQLSILAAPWYLFWGLPYALASGTIEAYLVALPISASLLDEAGNFEPAWQGVTLIVVCCCAVDVYATLRRRRLSLALA